MLSTDFAHFDFGLSSDQEARAVRLHHESIVVDMLYWGPVGYRSIPEELEAQLLKCGDNPAAIELETYRLLQGQAGPAGALGYREAWEASGVTAGSRDIDLTDHRLASRSFGFHQAQFDKFDWLVKALCADDIRRAKAEGKRAGFLNTQMTGGVTLELLESHHQQGLRMLMLTYNNMNHLGAGCTERTDAGVSNYGAAMIKLMNLLGIIVDTSHCGHQTTLDACAISSVPVIASHTCCEAVMKHNRAKSDEELRRIAATGGIVGIVTVPFFLGEGETTIEKWLDHIDHAAQLIGWQHVGIGSDWPMFWPKSIVNRFFSPANLAAMGFRPEHNIEPSRNLVGFDDYRDFPNITRGLVKRGYTDEQVKGILGENFLRVFDDVQSAQTARTKEVAAAGV